MKADGEGSNSRINEEKYKYKNKYHKLFHISNVNMKADDGIINSPDIAYFPLWYIFNSNKVIHCPVTVLYVYLLLSFSFFDFILLKKKKYSTIFLACIVFLLMPLYAYLNRSLDLCLRTALLMKILYTKLSSLANLKHSIGRV